MNHIDKDVLHVAVIGAGFSGLAAARALSAAGLARIAVLEARDRVGGRVFNGNVAKGFPVELGGTWVGPGQWAVIELAQELRVGLRPQFNKGDGYAIVEGQAMRVPTTAHPISDEGFVAQLDALAMTVPTDAPWTAPRAAEWDAMTYHDYLAGANLSAEDRATLDLMTVLSYGALPDAMSFLHVLQYNHAAGGFNRLEATEGGAQEQRVVGGSHVIALKMAEELGDIVRLASPVTEIRGWDKSGPVEIETANGLVKARRAILALSPSQAAGIRFTPILPAAKTALIQAWPTTSTGIKVFMSYDNPFWRKQGLSGSIFNFGGAFLWAADASPDDESIGVLGTLGMSGDGLTSAQRKAAILEALAKCFGPEAMNPTAYVEQDWGRETYARGCVSPLPKGMLTRHGTELRAPTGRLLWAGTETATIWTGYLDGAIRAGRRAAAEALAALAQET
jgi:monoamine oxidase